MKDLEKVLEGKKEELLMVEVPEEMEDCLRNALNERKKHIPKSAVVAALIAILLIAYSFDSVAYYGKKFIGYDNVIEGNLKDLNEEGKGQEINKSCTFSNGIEITLDGVIFDENELVAFYKIRNTKEKLDFSKFNFNMWINGINTVGYSEKWSRGEDIDDYCRVYVGHFATPTFYEKWMRLNITLYEGDTKEEKSIGFTLDRNKAMKRTIEKKVNAKVRVGNYEIYFNKFTASLLSTYIDGGAVALKENEKDAFDENVETKEEYAVPHIKFDIVTDKGEKVNLTDKASGGSVDKVFFNKDGGALPKDFNTLKIKNIRLETYKIINKSFDVSFETKDLKVDDDIIVKKIYYEGNETNIVVSSRGIPYIGMVSEEDSVAYLNLDQDKICSENEEPIDRIYSFTGQPKNFQLQFKCVASFISTDETINIPID